MASITALTDPKTVAPAKTPAAAAIDAAAKKNSMDFNMFLKMLTTQMQNQDPLDPMDTSEYTAQLVQYSQVEQSIQQTGTLKDILSRLTTQDMAQASGFIGREARFDTAVAGLTEAAPAKWGYAAARPLGGLTATIRDGSGTVVDTRTLDAAAASGRFDWDGLRSNGVRSPDGAYTVSFAGTDRAGAAVPVAVTSHGIVDEVTTAGGAISLGVNGVPLPAGKLIRVALSG